MSTIIKIDAPLALADTADAAPDALRLLPTGVRAVNGDTRSYFVMQPPTRLLIVLRNGLTFDDLAGMAAVEALVGWDEGYPGFVQEVGKRHSKMTVLGPASGPADTTLSAVIANAPPNQPETRKLTLPASIWQLLSEQGNGDPAAAIRALIA